MTNILSDLNIPYRNVGEHHHATEGFVQIDCPFCSKDSHKFRLGISLSGSFSTCWVCGYHPIIETLMEITGYSSAECKRILKDINYKEVKRKRPKGNLVIPKGVRDLQGPHKRYLRSRGFNWRELKDMWKIQGIGIASRLSWRIFIPIIHHGEMISWTTRSISDSNKIPRYINASLEEESMSHKSLLYGEDYAYQKIIVTEGPFDVWRIGPGAVATLGIGYSLEQILRIAEYSKRIICFDNEKTAQERAKRLCNELSVFPGETLNIQLDAKDAASATDDEIEQIRKEIRDK